MAALFLAAKVEDQLDDHKLGKTMRMRDILNVFFHIKRNRQGKRIRPLSLGARVRVLVLLSLCRVFVFIYEFAFVSCSSTTIGKKD